MPFALVGTTVPNSASNRTNAPQLYSCAHYHHFASASTVVATAGNGTKRVRPLQRLEAHARRSSIHSSDDEWVTFDGEEEWNDQVGIYFSFCSGGGLGCSRRIPRCFSYVYSTDHHDPNMIAGQHILATICKFIHPPGHQSIISSHRKIDRHRSSIRPNGRFAWYRPDSCRGQHALGCPFVHQGNSICT